MDYNNHMLEEIKRAYFLGKTLVFPTEVAARSNMRAYVRETDGALFKDSSISWDTFKALCSKEPADRKPATTLDRILFSEEFYKAESKKLKYYISNSFPEADESFKAEISAQLPYFFAALEHKQSLSADIVHDIDLIYRRYTDYLDAKGLYEKEYLKPDFTTADSAQYILVLPDCVSDPSVKEALKYFKTIEYNPELPLLDVYDNSFCELRNAVRKIYGLLKNGTRAEDIAVTLTDFDNVLPYLEEETYKRNIVINPIKGKNLIEYRSGCLFTYFKDLVEKDFEFETLRAFLLNPSFPFKDIEENRNIVRTLARNNTYGGLKTHFEKLEDSSRLENLSLWIKSAVTAKTCDDLRRAVNGFQTDFFKDGSFSSTGKEVDIDVFRKCMDILDLLEKEEPLNADVFTVFTKILSQTKYTPNTGAQGIKIYEYPVSCGLNLPYHFIIGLDDESTKKQRKPINFISKKQTDNEKLKGEEIGSEIIKSFALSSNVKLSCSKQTFSSSVTIASLFDKESMVRKAKTEDDSFKEEERIWDDPGKKHGKPGIKQAQCFRRSKLEEHVNLSKTDIFPKPPENLKLSATSIKEYETCPYGWMVRYIDSIEEEQLDPQTQDALEIGNILHSTYEEFFNENRNSCSLFSTDEFQKRLVEIFKTKITNYSFSTNAPDSLHIYRILSDYSKKIGKIAKVKEKARTKFRLEQYRVFDMERSFSFSGDGYTCNGRIDCVLQTPEETYAVIDFKKKNVDKTSVQLFLYAKALKQTRGVEKYPSIGTFYSIENERFTDCWATEEDIDVMAVQIEERISNVAKQINEGDFHRNPSAENCANCAYSRICRARYVIK